MTISIVVPVYNLEKYIAKCLDSILAQTYQDIEIIVVDDGSSDSSADIIRSYAEEYASIHPVFKKNGGVTDARMCGISQSRGEWIGFVDGDDVIEPDMYERLLENAIKNDADISHCGYRICLPDGRINYLYNTGAFRVQNRLQGIRDLLDGNLIEPSLCTKLFKRELFENIEDLIPKTIKNNEDLLMNYYLFSKSEKAVFEDWCPYHYMATAGSASRAEINRNRVYDPVLVKEIILKNIPDQLSDCAKKAYLITCMHTYGTLLEKKGAVASGYQKDIRQRVIQKYEWRNLLGRKSRVFIYMIKNHPHILGLLYPWYLRHVQKSRYR